MLLSLTYEPPFAWDELLRFLRDRAIPGVESVEGDVYRRTVRHGDAQDVIEVQHVSGALAVRIPATLDATRIVPRLRVLFEMAKGMIQGKRADENLNPPKTVQ